MENYCAYCMSPRKGNFCGFCGHQAGEYVPMAHHLQPGTVLNGKYLVGRALGEGGFGITYIGLDQLLGLKVAIKEYFPSGLVNRNSTATAEVSANLGDALLPFEKGRSRFLQEAQILAKFAGEPGIVGIRDFFTANNTAYIVMEYLEGVTLRDYLKKHGTMTFDGAINLLSPVMQSLQKVHEQELIHRDISPDNIMLLNNGQVKLLDFGAARNVTGLDERSLSVMLKPGFAPEEQYRTKGRQGPWTDVYALSATIYRCITGQNPEESMNRVFADETPLPSALGAVITPAQEAALMKGLAVLQKNRYQSVEALLQGFAGAEIDPATATGPKTAATDPYATHFEPAPAVIASRVHVSQDRTPPPAQTQPTRTPPLTQTTPSAPVKQRKEKPKKPAKAAPAAAAATEGAAKEKKPQALALLGGTILFLGGIFLAALCVYGFLDSREEHYLITAVMGFLAAAGGSVLSRSYIKRLPKGAASKLCRVLGFVILFIALVFFGIMMLVKGFYSLYLINVVFEVVYAYVMLRSGFASNKGRRRLNIVCICGVVLLVVLLIFSVVSRSLTTVTIGDQRIPTDATNVSISVDMMTQKQLEKLTTLRQLESLSITASFLDDSAIPYIAELTGLVKLNLYGNSDIQDVSGLSTLTNLTELNLSGTSISDVSVLENMPNMQHLYLSDTLVEDPSPINGLSELVTLSLSGVTTADFSKLVVPSTVYNLYLNGTGISDLSLVSTMDSLNILEAEYNDLTEISPLQKFEEADTIRLGSNQITDLTGLPSCQQLELQYNDLTDISPVAACSKLWILDLTGNEISDVSPLGSCPRMVFLYAAYNEISDISAFINLNLTCLEIGNNQITDISPLATCISMEYLYIENNQVTDISVLSNMPALHTFHAYNNEISDISPMLDTMLPQNATWMPLYGNNISDISPLAQFTSLTRAELAGNPITDLSPLASCGALAAVDANETLVEDIACLSGLPELNSVQVIRTNVTDYTIAPGIVDEELFLRVSYCEDMNFDQIDALREQGIQFYIYDVPENMLSVVREHGSVATVAETDLYLHPVEEITEAVEELTAEIDTAVGGSVMEDAQNG